MKKFIIALISLNISLSSYASAPDILCDTEGANDNINDKLIVGVDSKGRRKIWSTTDRQQLSYCISNDFKELKSKMTKAFQEAVDEWERYANIRFIHLRSQDSKCNDSNRKVVFRVNMFNDPNSNLAGRAFFPYAPVAKRKIIFNKKYVRGSNNLLRWLVKHEVGHVIGVRHEHIHPDNNKKCHESGSVDIITKYDKRSIMHYKQCNGYNPNPFLSSLDKKGIKKVYR